MAMLPHTHEAKNVLSNLFRYAADSAKLQVAGPCAIRDPLPQFAMELLALASCIQGPDSWPSGQPLVDLLQLWFWAIVISAPVD